MVQFREFVLAQSISKPLLLSRTKVNKRLRLDRQAMKEQIVTWINRLLVADVFLVLFGFIWFAIAVMGRYLNIPLGFDLWYRLWVPVFNPAIGILFLGVFATWAIERVYRQIDSN